MKLYLISQSENDGYDTYDAFVVCAENEEDAKVIRELDEKERWGTWVTDTKHIEVKYLGEADKSIPRGEILGSFNAG